ncbi:MAG TPA: ATP-binding protein, partial [Egibacteraceae bacterium]|nr:ATP-binding protein [Egibacteraceae bacterium]
MAVRPAAEHEVGRGSFRLALIAATTAMILGSLPFLPRHLWPRAWELALVAGLGAALVASTALPFLRRFWAVAGGTAVLGMITLLCVVTGGPDSPYTVLYLIYLLYGAIFNTRRRLVAEAVLLVAAAGLLLGLDSEPTGRDAFVAVLRLASLLIVGAVVHGLVAQLRRIARRLESSEQQYRSLVEYNPDAVHTFDLQARFTSANPAAAAVSGYSTDELRQMRDLPLQALLAPEAVEHTMAGFRATAEGRPQHFETVIVNRHGERVELQVATVPIVVDGKVVGVYSVSKDITESKRAARLLGGALAQQAAVGRLGQSALVAADPEALLDEAASLVAQTLRVPLAGVFELHGEDEAVLVAGSGWRAGVVGSAVVPATAPYDVGLARASEEPVVVADYVMADDGRPTPLLEEHHAGSAMSVALRSRDAVFGVLAVYDREPRDFTDDERTFIQTVANVLASAIGRRRAEQQLLQAQKLQAVGQLAGGIAHDFNNLLTAMLGYCELLEPRVRDHPMAAKHLEEALKAGERARALVDQILTFSRGRVSSPARCDLNDTLRGLKGLLLPLLPEDIDLRLELDPALGALRADPTQLEQVVLNLALNARDAMPGGGELRVATANAEVDRARGDRLGLPAGSYVTLTVEDAGTGMDAVTATRLFEPFFTTKADGNGLGLATVYGIVTSAGGQIQVESQPGHGARFTVYLPRVAADTEPAAAAPAPERRPAR